MNWRWWAAHIELSIGIAAVVLAPLLIIAEPNVMGGWPAWVSPLRLAAMLALVAGFAWMLRIYRGQEKPAPPWRYRDRR